MKKVCFLITFILLFFACAKKEEGFIGEQGGRLVIGTTDLPKTISPLAPSLFGSNEILDLLFMHLHRIDPLTGKMKPELAWSWEFSEDLTSLTYYLRKDAKWWDGKPVTAEDVLYTFNKMKDPATKYPNSASLGFIKDVEILDPYTIRFNFSKVYADLLMDSDIMAVPKHIYEKLGVEFGKNPMGNGPYKIKTWIPDSTIVLTYNADYYRGRPPIDEIVIKYYADMGDLLSDFAGGNLDLALRITSKAAKSLAANQNITIDSRPGNTYTYIGWNLKNDFLKDRDIRRALEMAINKQKILNDVFAGMGTISLGPLPPTSWAYNDKIEPLQYDLVLAQEILKQKGFEDRNGNKIIDRNGKDFMINLITNLENPERVGILNGVADDLRALGIKVNIAALTAASFIDAIVNKNFDGFIMGWSVETKVDPAIYWHSDPAKGRLNFVSYNNPVIDSLINQGVAMLNRKKAKELWGQFQKIIYEDRPYAFLIVPNNISAYYKRVRGTEQGVALAQAYTYWIPEAERRVVVAAAITTTPPVEKPTPEKKPPAVVEPERLLEAAVKKETTTVVSTPEIVPVTPPKPSVITTATPIKQVEPKYPESARSIGATGRIVVRAVVGVDGKVKKTTILKSFGNPACEDAALAAAAQWEFTPATKDGVPFEQNVSIPFDFRP